MACIFHNSYGLLEDLPFLPMTRFDPDLSCCVMTDERVNGFLLVHRLQSDSFIVELFSSMEPDANIHLLNMMCFAARAVAGLKSEDVKVLLRRHNKGTEGLVGNLFPEKKGETVRMGERKVL